MEEIKLGDELKLCVLKRDNLRKALEKVQSHSSDVLVFNLQWSDLEENLKSVQEKLEKMFKEIQSKEVELQNRSIALEERAKVVEAAEAQMSGLKRQIDEKGEELSVLKKLVEECMVTQSSKTIQLNELFETLRKTQLELDLKGQQLADLERHRVEVSAEKEHLDMAQARGKELDEEIEKKKRDLNMVLDKTAECLKRLETRTSDLITTQGDIELKLEHLGKVEVDLEKHQGELKAVMENVDRSQTRHKELEEEIERKMKALTTVLDKLAECEKLLEARSSELVKTQGEVESKKGELGKMETDHERHKAELSAEMKHLAKSQTRNRELAVEIERKRKDLNTVLDKIGECGKLLQTRSSELKTIQSELKLKGEQLGKMKTCNRELDEQIETKKKDLTEVMDKIAEYGRSLDVLDKRKDSQQKLLVSKEEALILDIGLKEQMVISLNNDLETKAKEMEEIERMIEERRAHCESIKMLIAEHTEELASKEKEKKVIMEAIGKLSMELACKEKRFQRTKEITENLSDQLHSKQWKIQTYTDDVETKKKELHSVSGKLKECLQNVKGKERHLRYLDSLIKERKEQVEEGKKEVQHLDNSDKELITKQLHVKQEEVCSIEKAIMECSSELESKRKHLDQVQSLLTELTPVLQSKEAELNSLGKKIEDSYKDLKSKEQQQVRLKVSLLEREQELAQKKKELDGLEERIGKKDELLKSTEDWLSKSVKDYEARANLLASFCQQSNPNQHVALGPVNNVLLLDYKPVQQPPNEMQNSLSCVKSNQETSRSCKPNAEKKSANDGESSGQPSGFLLFGKNINIPKKSRDILRPTTGQRRHGSACNSKKRERDDDESLSQSRGKGFPARWKGATSFSGPQTHAPSISASGKENIFSFENQRSADKFKINQVWAIYSHDKGMMPRKYVQIKRINNTSPGFKLHVAPLELYRPLNIMTTHPVCGGHFKLKNGIAEVLVPSNFSHQVKAVKIGANKYEVYPGEGEIWALYKNWNNTDRATVEELNIVEVVETVAESIHFVPLTAKVFNKLLYGRSQATKAGFSDIPKTEACRFFSHQIPARSATWFGDGKCWELDPKAVP